MGKIIVADGFKDFTDHDRIGAGHAQMQHPIATGFSIHDDIVFDVFILRKHNEYSVIDEIKNNIVVDGKSGGNGMLHLSMTGTDPVMIQLPNIHCAYVK